MNKLLCLLRRKPLKGNKVVAFSGYGINNGAETIDVGLTGWLNNCGFRCHMSWLSPSSEVAAYRRIPGLNLSVRFGLRIQPVSATSKL